MFCTRNLKRQKRNATLVVETLDDRLVLSAASAVGTHATAAVEVTRATTDSAGLIHRFDAALDGINGLVNRGLNHFNGQVNNQIGGVDTVTQALIGPTVAGINNFASVNVAREAVLNRVTSAVVNPFDRFISRFDVGLNRYTREINNQLIVLGRQFDTTDSALESAVIAVTANVRAEEAADSGQWLSELQGGRANLQNEIDQPVARSPALIHRGRRVPYSGGPWSGAEQPLRRPGSDRSRLGRRPRPRQARTRRLASPPSRSTPSEW
jgi:hypothetical protein